MKCLEATDSNGTELYLFQLEDNSFISVPKKTVGMETSIARRVERNERRNGWIVGQKVLLREK